MNFWLWMCGHCDEQRPFTSEREMDAYGDKHRAEKHPEEPGQGEDEPAVEP